MVLIVFILLCYAIIVLFEVYMLCLAHLSTKCSGWVIMIGYCQIQWDFTRILINSIIVY